MAWVQQRRADLTALTRKYGETIDDVLAWGKASAQRLDALLNSDSRIEALEPEVARLDAERTAAAQALGQGPRAPRPSGSPSAVTGELAHLAMGQATVDVAVTPRPAGLARHGGDDVEILLAANPGQPGPHGRQGGLRR